MEYLIVGCGPAGIAAAKEVAKTKKNETISIITREKEQPYMRSLLPLLITGEGREEEILDPQGRGLEDIGIEVIRGVPVSKVDTKGSHIVLSDGTVRSYDRLLLATGGRTTVPGPLQMESGDIIRFDSLGNARRIREKAESPGRALVYGPGYLAIVASGALIKLGLEVVWFRPPLPRHGYPIFGELEARFLDDLIHKGVDMREGADIAACRREEEGSLTVEDMAGDSINCSMIVVATERIPEIGYLAGSNIATDTGVIVNDRLETSVSGVFAAGDCAELRDERSDRVLINFGWRSAIRQGQLAGANMAGGNKRIAANREDFLWQVLRSPKG